MANSVPTYSQFIGSYKQFESLLPEEVTAQISLSGRILSVSAWGEFYSDAIMLDVAHTLSLQHVSGSDVMGAFQAAAGPMTSASAAGMSASFQSPALSGRSDSEQWYLKTIYGQQFLRLRHSVIPMGVLSA